MKDKLNCLGLRRSPYLVVESASGGARGSSLTQKFGDTENYLI